MAICASPTTRAASLNTTDGPVTVNNWGYQLQGPASVGGELRSAPLAAAAHDLIVIDYARFGDAASAFTPDEVTRMKQRDGGSGQRRVAAAYISIGEASDFRTYWNPDWTSDGKADGRLTDAAPPWLGPVNPDFPESRKVRYWDADWQTVMANNTNTGYLDTIVGQGYDAAYLDIVDAYYFWGEEATAAQKQAGDPTDVQDAARRMINFIVDITATARRTNPDFFVIPQNGAFILNDADFGGSLDPDPQLRESFLDAIGAIGVEDLYFGGDEDEDNPFNPDADTIAILKADFLANGKPVFVVDYLTDQTKASQFIEATVADGFIPYVAPSRDLDTLNPPSVPEPATLVTFLGLTLFLHQRRRFHS